MPYEDWIKLATGTARLIEADGSDDLEAIGSRRIGSAAADEGRHRLEAIAAKHSIGES